MGEEADEAELELLLILWLETTPFHMWKMLETTVFTQIGFSLPPVKLCRFTALFC